MWLKRLVGYCEEYRDLFQCGKRNSSEKACSYLQGLFHESKSNIERMSERVSGAEAQQLNHFISDSPWDAKAVIKRVAEQSSKLFSTGQSKEKVGLLLDESGWRKSGKHSVGVARQYLGSIGKTENGQVGTFAALVQHEQVSLVNGRLFLPKNWAKDTNRCRKAGIPKEHIKHKTKPELALEMVKEISEQQVHFDWVGGDGLYGNAPHLRHSLDEMGLLYVLDIHADQRIYTEHPKPYIPEQPSGKGRKKSVYESDQKTCKVEKLIAGLGDEDWETITCRRGTKGPLKRQVYCQKVFVRDGNRTNDDHVEIVRLLVSRNIDGSEIKYSFVNDVNEPLELKELLYMQMQRYWVERAFQDVKSQLGMTDYQVRTWRAWHHHIALTMMAQLFMLRQKQEHKEKTPLLSCSDIKLILASTLPTQNTSLQECERIIQKRHKARQRDLDRYQNLK